MADLVERTLADESVALVEAGTGTGKTLAYLVPAVLSGKRVVISTGTKTLQDQIMRHDIPLLERVMPVPFRAAMMKGLNNYLCLRRYHEFLASSEASSSSFVRDTDLLRSWRDSTLSGERSDLGELAEESPIWSHVHSGSETRIGARCTHFDDCFVTKMRSAAESAQILVVNHHLYFADLAMREANGMVGVIPEHDAVVFDEAHQIEDVATEFFGVQVSSTRLETLARDAERAFVLNRCSAEAGNLVRDITSRAADFFAALPRAVGQEGARVPLVREAFSGSVQDKMFGLDASLEAFASFCKLRVADSEVFAQLTRRAQQVREDIAQIARGGTERDVTWTAMRGRRVAIGSSPVDVSEVFRENVLYRERGVILTSATLAIGGSFKFIEQRLGVNFEATSEVLQSPFDYKSQAALYLPENMPDPRAPEFFERAAQEIQELLKVTGGGAFILCTSIRAQNELARRIRPHLDVPSWIQGEAPKATLIERFRESGHAVLFATTSFWEGVDVPGHALRLVVIDKLPFDVPNDPLIVARCERLRAEEKEPFMSYLVPSAALALKQGFGRLIRTRRDRGIVAILDPRLTKKGYGKVFLRGLPDATRCATLDQVKSFWSELSGAPPAK